MLLVSIYLFEMVMSLPVCTYMCLRWVVVVVCYLLSHADIIWLDPHWCSRSVV